MKEYFKCNKITIKCTYNITYKNQYFPGLDFYFDDIPVISLWAVRLGTTSHQGQLWEWWDYGDNCWFSRAKDFPFPHFYSLLTNTSPNLGAI